MIAAACHPVNTDVEPHTFDVDLLPGETHAGRTERHRRAAIVCAKCPIAGQCLTDALADPEREGVYAGYPLQIERQAA